MKIMSAKISIVLLLLLVNNLLPVHASMAHQNKFTIRGEFEGNVQANEVMLMVWNNVFSSGTLRHTTHKTTYQNVVNNRFKVDVSLDSALSYFVIDWRTAKKDTLNYRNFYPYLIEAGDDITIKIKPLEKGAELIFTGHGSEKYNCIQQLSRNRLEYGSLWSEKHTYPPGFKSQYIKRRQDFSSDLIREQHKILDAYRSTLTPYIYEVLSATIVTESLSDMARYLTSDWPAYSSENKETAALALQKVRKTLDDLKIAKGDGIVQKAFGYPMLLVHVTYIESIISGKSILDVINSSINDNGIEQLIAGFLMTRGERLETKERDSLHVLASEHLKNPYYLNLVTNLSKAKTTGAEMYDFGLPDINGKIIKLSDFRGKVVFVDFWYSGCWACADYYQEVVKPVKEYFHADNEIVFISISVDKDKSLWRRSIDGGKFTSKDGVNLHCANGNSPVIFQNHINAYPHPQVIDRNGRLVSDSEEELRFRGPEGLIQVLEAAKCI